MERGLVEGILQEKCEGAGDSIHTGANRNRLSRVRFSMQSKKLAGLEIGHCIRLPCVI
jgi:hypothetical protein